MEVSAIDKLIGQGENDTYCGNTVLTLQHPAEIRQKSLS
jgi:hypothetical protein